MQPAFEPERRNGAAANMDVADDDMNDDADTSITVMANGVYAYNCDWNDIEKSGGPTHAAARRLHRARHRTGTSRWWSMRWPSDAVSLLGRACDLNAGKTYDLTRQLCEHSASHRRQLWRPYDGPTPAPRRLWGSAASPGRVERNEAQARAGMPQLQTRADAGMSHCG